MLPNQKDVQCPFPVSTNSRGLRSKEVRPLEGQYRILALGDSRTLGSGIYDSETWPALLEARLNEFVPNYFEVINAGVGGYSAYQGMRYLEKYVHEFKPQLVVACFGTNDWHPIPPGTRGLVEWDDLTQRWGIEALVREAFKGVCASIAPSPFGPRTMRMRPGEFTDCYVRMRELSLEVGADLAVMYLPSTVDVTPVPHTTSPVQCLMQGIAGYTGAKFLNPITVFPDKCDSLFVDPTHFTLEGNKVITEYIVDTLFADYKRQHAAQM